ncbi:MAG TPA: Txe/YoeB family addiction module toxin, partial [Methylococcaceae bacterium]|nr:Txe/YoeB family addiction module toxin [Methylococcaceae bacterium]
CQASDRTLNKAHCSRTLFITKSLITQDPCAYPPEFEFLKGDLKGAISRRINKQHRLVYEVLENEQAIKIIMMWMHYDHRRYHLPTRQSPAARQGVGGFTFRRISGIQILLNTGTRSQRSVGRFSSKSAGRPT